MKFAVNYSKALVQLFKKDPKLPVDYIKVPTIPFPDCWVQFNIGEEYRPIWPHPAQPGVLSLGHLDPEMRFNEAIIREVLNKTKPPFLSTHLEASVEYFPELVAFQHRSSDLVHRALADRFLETISKVKEATGISLALENFPYYSWWRHFHVASEPSFIREICECSDSGFLLDIAHARCSAWHMGIDEWEYIIELPLNRLCEIHLAGTVWRQETGRVDMHIELDERDYFLLEKVLGINHPKVITLEYGGMPDRIFNKFTKTWDSIRRNEPDILLDMISRIDSKCRGNSRKSNVDSIQLTLE